MFSGRSFPLTPTIKTKQIFFVFILFCFLRSVLFHIFIVGCNNSESFFAFVSSSWWLSTHMFRTKHVKNRFLLLSLNVLLFCFTLLLESVYLTFFFLRYLRLIAWKILLFFSFFDVPACVSPCFTLRNSFTSFFIRFRFYVKFSPTRGVHDR